MQIAIRSRLTLRATITPADKLAVSGDTYKLGFEEVEFTIPNTADAIITRELTTANGSSQTYEPDINNWNSEGALPDPDGVTVALDTIYAVILKNADASLAATYSCTSGLGSWAGNLSASSYALLHSAAGFTVGASDTIGLTGVSGTPIVNVCLIGEYA